MWCAVYVHTYAHIKTIKNSTLSSLTILEDVYVSFFILYFRKCRISWVANVQQNAKMLLLRFLSHVCVRLLFFNIFFVLSISLARYQSHCIPASLLISFHLHAALLDLHYYYAAAAALFSIPFDFICEWEIWILISVKCFPF